MDPTGNPFKFMIWATDDPPDTLCIRFWWEADGVETDVYDNGAEQAIGAGKIIVHTKWTLRKTDAERGYPLSVSFGSP